jgi:hypothetical protein
VPSLCVTSYHELIVLGIGFPCQSSRNRQPTIAIQAANNTKSCEPIRMLALSDLLIAFWPINVVCQRKVQYMYTSGMQCARHNFYERLRKWCSKYYTTIEVK